MRALMPPKFIPLSKAFGNKPFRMLDIGAGNHSALHTKKWFPNCEYHGVDRQRDYKNDEGDFKLMAAFYETDLTTLEFSGIPEGFFDVIMMNHVIEHLHNGEKVIQALLSKLMPGGYIYIEYPSFRSTRLPSKKGSLNFFDDSSHCRLYHLADLYNLLMANDFLILAGGTRRVAARILLLPLNLVVSKIKNGYVSGNVFWDLLGFAEYVWARRK